MMEYIDEFGNPLPRWKPLAIDERGRFSSFSSAVDSARKALTIEHNTFFDSLADVWPSVFPNCPARPGRFENGRIFLYVSSAPALFSFRPKLAAVKKKLLALPGAPEKLTISLEIRK